MTGGGDTGEAEEIVPDEDPAERSDDGEPPHDDDPTAGASDIGGRAAEPDDDAGAGR